MLPDDFAPNETADQMANDFGLALADELAAFTDHHSAHGTTFKDWQAAFRTWLRNSNKFAQRQPGIARNTPARRVPAVDGFAGRNYTGGKL